MKKIWLGVGEVEAAAGLDHGLEEDHSVICRPGRGPDGYSASAEDLAGDYGGGTRTIIHGSAQDSHGFQDGGGLTHTTGIAYLMLATAGGATHSPFQSSTRGSGTSGEVNFHDMVKRI